MAERPVSYDLSRLCCPHCGCNAVDVLRYPMEAQAAKRRWWDQGNGKARCEVCKREFRIEAAEE